MLKASALCPVGIRNEKDASTPLFFGDNITVEYAKETTNVPLAVEELAYRMYLMDAEIKSVLYSIRLLYLRKCEDFRLDLSDKSNDAKKQIVSIFSNLCGVVSNLHYCAGCGILSGKLIFSHKAQAFLTGQYMEIAVRKVVNDMIGKLSKEFDRQFNVFNNVKLLTVDGIIKNEFDIVIKNVTQNIIYVIEVKSGKNFSDYGKIAKIGREYGIVPDRLLLIDNHMSTTQTETIEYFCEYYVANLEDGNFEKKLIQMIKSDLI